MKKKSLKIYDEILNFLHKIDFQIIPNDHWFYLILNFSPVSLFSSDKKNLAQNKNSVKFKLVVEKKMLFFFVTKLHE